MNGKLRWLICLTLCLTLVIPIGAQAAASPSPASKATPTPEVTLCPEPEEAPEMYLTAVEGTYTLTDALGHKVDLEEDGTIAPGCIISTKEKSYVTLALGDQAIIRMDENSTVALHLVVSYIELLLEKGSILYHISDTEQSGYSLALRTSISQVEVESGVGILTTDIETKLDHEGKTQIGSVISGTELTVLAGEANITFWKTEALTPASLDKVKKQKITVVAGEKAQLQDVTVLEDPNEEDGGRAIRREQTSKVTDENVNELLNNVGFLVKAVNEDKQLVKAMTSTNTGVTSTEIKQATKNMKAIVAASEADHNKENEANQELLKEEQDVLSSMVEAASAYWYEVMYVFPLSDAEKLNPIPTEAPTPAPTPTPIPGSVTVNLVYNGEVFGAQQVLEGYAVAKPILSPTKKGMWCEQNSETEFAFYKTEIRSDITLYWIEED